MSSKKLVNILLHVLFTALVVIVPVFLMPLKDSAHPDFLNIARIAFTLLQSAAFYFNAYVLYPRFLLRKKVVSYILSVIGICAAIAAIPVHAATQPVTTTVYAAHYIVSFFIGLFVMGTATCYRFIFDVIKSQHLQQEQLRSELSFLRSQVSPHFMFNTLNSMISLARKKSDKLEPALLKMSGLMRYMLYDSDEEKVTLAREIEYIHNYIELQTLRFGDMVKILLLVQPPDEEYYIEPMLLVPLVENAFKHGTGVVNDPEIIIQLNARQKQVFLEVSNKKENGPTATADKANGIGLANLRRRLNILYPGKYQLDTEEKEHGFLASLKIQLTHDKLPRR
jgi:LytS/YehU family sensor histidine kinase